MSMEAALFGTPQADEHTAGESCSLDPSRSHQSLIRVLILIITVLPAESALSFMLGSIGDSRSLLWRPLSMP